jgi:hypothetical protein
MAECRRRWPRSGAGAGEAAALTEALLHIDQAAKDLHRASTSSMRQIVWVRASDSLVTHHEAAAIPTHRSSLLAQEAG